MHMPANPGLLEPFLDRLRYEELYRLALTLRWSKREFRHPGRSLTAGELPSKLQARLPFELTSDQREAIAVLHRDAAEHHRMHRLLQGDVGSGKTIVALFACLPALNCGMQVAWLTPTEVLASQTHALFSRLLGPLGFSCALLKGGISSADKRNLLFNLRNGKLNLVVGTHALLQPSVGFDKLGMIVIDEQHKFGLDQRLVLQRKDPAADYLLMSATPIPQTLAKTLYGDLDIVTIRSMPSNRKPVSTHVVTLAKRLDMLQFVRQTVTGEEGQAFYIVPRVEASEEETDPGLQSAIAMYDTLRRDLFSEIPIGMVHGRLAPDEKERVMKAFAEGALKVLVATTVVEVGVDVPQASIIVIENPELFGLSQLHQLRGRVGRGTKKGFCFLLVQDELEEVTLRRLKDFCRMHDGFAIAELDLKYRGPGEVVGSRQSGWEDLRLVDILRDAPLFVEIQQEVDRILEPGVDKTHS
jgi:ATP-dependent DNA helicase RecG